MAARDAQYILDTVYELSHTTSGQVDNSTVLKYINIIKDSVWSRIINGTNENYYWQEWKSNTAINQGEYLIPDVAFDTSGAKKLNTVSVNYDNQTYTGTGALKYIKADLVDPSDLPEDWSFYQENQSEVNPIYYISDESIFVAPVTTAIGGIITNGLKLTGIRKIADYIVNGVDGEVATTTEANIVIPVDHIPVLVQGVIPYVFRKQGQIEKANVETQEFERQLQKTVEQLAERKITSHFGKYPEDINTVDPQRKIYPYFYR